MYCTKLLMTLPCLQDCFLLLSWFFRIIIGISTIATSTNISIKYFCSWKRVVIDYSTFRQQWSVKNKAISFKPLTSFIILSCFEYTKTMKLFRARYMVCVVRSSYFMFEPKGKGWSYHPNYDTRTQTVIIKVFRMLNGIINTPVSSGLIILMAHS